MLAVYDKQLPQVLAVIALAPRFMHAPSIITYKQKPRKHARLVIWGRGLGLVTHTGSIALRAIEKAGVSVLFWDPLIPEPISSLRAEHSGMRVTRIWGRGLGLVTHTGSLKARHSVGAIEKAGASVLFWDPLIPRYLFHPCELSTLG